MSEEVKDYGEPIRFFNESLLDLDVVTRKGICFPAGLEAHKRMIACVNLLANFQTDPQKMTKREELVIGLVRAIADGDEGAFCGNLDDLLFLLGTTLNQEVEVTYGYERKRSVGEKEVWDIKGDGRLTIEAARECMEESQKYWNPIGEWRIVRILSKKEVVE